MGVLFICVVALTLYPIAVVIYRAFFHPLSRIPGPFLASITYLYQFYYNRLGETSSFYLQIDKLHEHYGPVVRISPHEVHLSDPANHQTIHRVGTKFTKDPAFYRVCFGSPLSHFTAQDNAIHRARRSVLAPLFTRARVLELEHVVQKKVSKLCNRMQELMASSQPVNLYHAARCISFDTITEYAFDNCRNLLDTPDFSAAALDGNKKGQPRLWEIQQFSLDFAAQKRPEGLIVAQVREIQRRVNAGEKPADGKRTIFHQLLDPNAGEGHVVPPVEAMGDEARVIVTAGGETVGITLTMAFYRVLANEPVRNKVLAELKAAFPNPEVEMKFAELEKLPYLTAVLKESLRLSFPLPGRLPRLVPEGGAIFNGHHIPAGMAVSMSQWMQHTNPGIYPEPMTFEPGRWLSLTEKGNGGPEDYFIAFGRGSRACLGMTLAWCELYVTLGTVMRRFGDRLELSGGISAEDFYPFDDYVTLWQRDGANKLSVVAK